MINSARPRLKSASLGDPLKIAVLLSQLRIIMSSQNHVQRQEEDRGLLLGHFHQGNKFTEAPSVYLGHTGQRWFTCSPVNQPLERGVELTFLV